MNSSREQSTQRWLVAVDGGGSKIAVAAAIIGSKIDEHRYWHFEGTGSAHPSTWHQAADNLVRALNDVALELNKAADHIVAVRLALAGAGRGDDQQRVIETLKRHCPWLNSPSVDCVGDIQPLIDHGSQGARSIAVILGTGSVVACRDDNQQIVRAGGWGPLLGDACSGGTIGLSALRYVSQLLDEGQLLEQIPELAQRIVAELYAVHLHSPVSLNSLLIQTASDRTQTASLAGVVLKRAYQDGDRTAQELLEPHVADIVWQIRQVARRSATNDQAIQINFTGGIAQHHGPLRQAIVESCRAAGLNVTGQELVEPLQVLLQQMIVSYN